MKVFVSGVAGFLGSHVADHYLQAGATVAGIDNLIGGDLANVSNGVEYRTADCNDMNAYEDMLAGSDVVFHCAAAPYEGLSVFSPRLVNEHTYMSSVSLATASVKAGVRRFVFCSSMARYGAQQAPFTEDLTPQPVDPYGWSKLSAERALANLFEIHGIEFVVAVPHNIYGPRQRYIDPFRNVVSIMVNRILQGAPPIIYGDGSQRRTFSYINDVIGPLARMAEEEIAVGEVYNIGPDDSGVTVSELADLLLALTGSSLTPIHYPPRPREVHHASCSAAKAREQLAYIPVWSLADGARRQIDWIAERGPSPFLYHLPLEIQSDLSPVTWRDQLI